MRAPAISPVGHLGRLTCILAAVLLAAAMMAIPAKADEPLGADDAGGAAAVAELADDASSAEGDAAAAVPNAVGLGAAGAPTLAGYLSSGMLRVSADVALVDGDDEPVEPVVGSFTVDGLACAIVGEGQVALVAVSPRTLAGGLAGGDSAVGSSGAPSGEDSGSGVLTSPSPSPEGAPSDDAEGDVLALPEAVSYDGSDYSLAAIGPRALAGCGAATVVLPTSLESVGPTAFEGSPVAAVEVAEGSPHYSSYDGMFFDADLTCLLLIPEGKQGAARIPKTAEVVDPSSFSHSAGVDSIDVEAGSAAFSSRNGCLYDASGETLLRVPAGATDIQIADGCTTVAAGSMEGCASLAIIHAPASVVEVSGCAFGEGQDANDMVSSVIELALDDEATRACWEDAGLLGNGRGDGLGLQESASYAVSAPPNGNARIWAHACGYTVAFKRSSLDPFAIEQDAGAETYNRGTGWYVRVKEGEGYRSMDEALGIRATSWGVDPRVGLWVSDGSFFYVILHANYEIPTEVGKPLVLTGGFSKVSACAFRTVEPGGSFSDWYTQTANSGYYGYDKTYQISFENTMNSSSGREQHAMYQNTLAFDANTSSDYGNLDSDKEEDLPAAPSALTFAPGENLAMGDLPALSWPNRRFNGWYTASEGGSRITDGRGKLIDPSWKPSWDTTLYAQWVRKEFYVEYYTFDGAILLGRDPTNLNGMHRDGDTITFRTVPDGSSDLTTGWSTRKGSAAPDYAFGASKSMALNNDGGALKLFVAEMKHPWVYVHGNGGTFDLGDGEPHAQIDLKYGSVVFDSAGVRFTEEGGRSFPLSNPGCEFAHWTTESNESTHGNSTLEIVDLGREEAQHYWAIWRVPITWEPNGGKWEDGFLEARTSSHVSNHAASGFYNKNTESTEVPTKPGYAFKGWAEKPDDETGSMNIEPTTKATVYALWEGMDFTVTFDACAEKLKSLPDWESFPGEGTYAGSVPPSMTVTAGEDMPATPEWPLEAVGYRFMGWFDSPSYEVMMLWQPQSLEEHGIKQYYDSFGRSTRAWDKAEDATLYAGWAPKPLHVRYFNQDGSEQLAVPSDCVNFYYGVAKSLAPKLGTMGARAMGWALDPDQHVADFGFSEEAALRRNMDGGNVDLYLAETAQDMVRIYANGGKFVNPKYGNIVEEIWLGYGRTVFDDTGVDSEGYGGKFEMENPGCAFSHWTTSSDSATEGQERIELMLETSEHPRYWAIWKVPITWDPNGGHWGTPEDQGPRTSVHLTRNAAGGYEGSQVPAKKGHAFKGWGVSRDATEAQAVQQVSPVTKATVYAVWAPASYTLVFDANCEGAQVEPAKVSTTYGSDVELPVPANVSGYRFSGRWNTEKDGTGDSYDAGLQKGLCLDGAVEGGSVTLYAQWDPVINVDVPVRADFELMVDWEGGTVDVMAAGSEGAHAVCSFASRTPVGVRVSSAGQYANTAEGHWHVALAAFAQGDPAKAANLEKVRLSFSPDADGAQGASVTLADLYGSRSDSPGGEGAISPLDLSGLGLVVPAGTASAPGKLSVRFKLDCMDDLPLEDVAIGEAFPLLRLVYTVELAEA